MIKILIADPISKEGLSIFSDMKNVELIEQTSLSETELCHLIQDVDALLVRSQTQVTSQVISAAKKLKIIGRAGVGIDNIDLEAATQAGIIVLNAPDGNTITTSEHTFAMILSLSRHIPQSYLKLSQGTWDKKSFVGVELHGKTLAIIGLGRIGSEVAKRAKAFGMNLMGYDPFLRAEQAKQLGITLGTIEEVIQYADFVTVHTPLTSETTHLISTPEFSKMKKGVRVINCARGGIIDEHALLQAIKDGIVAGAALDVFEHEPIPENYPLLNHPQVVLTPHLGASTIEAQQNVAIDVCRQMAHILKDEPFTNAVNLPSISNEIFPHIQPFFKLATHIGQFLSQSIEGALTSVTVNYAGQVFQNPHSSLLRYFLEGILRPIFGKEVNIVNALHLTKQREIEVIEQTSTNTKGFQNLIGLTLETDRETRSVQATLLPGAGMRIVEIDKYKIELTPQGVILLVSHQDKPGLIGHVGSLLGKHEINIATMHVGRLEAGGSAMMALEIDKPLSSSLIHELSTYVQVKQIILPKIN